MAKEKYLLTCEVEPKKWKKITIVGLDIGLNLLTSLHEITDKKFRLISLDCLWKNPKNNFL